MNKNNMARKLAFCGLLLAFNSIIFMLVNIVDTNTIALMVVSSFIILAVVVEIGIHYSLMYLVCLSVLAFLLINNKLRAIVYISSLGNYGIVKALIESKLPIKPIPALPLKDGSELTTRPRTEKSMIRFNLMRLFNRQTPIKILYANMVLVLVYFEVKIFSGIPDLNFPYLISLFFIYQVGFLVYDYIFSLAIDFYFEKIKKRINFFN